MISIAMATYNGEKYIEEQLESLLNQTVLPDEIIICDDCSTDKTVQIIKDKYSCYGCIKLYVNEKNLGYRRNFKKAISLTQGDFIFLCDQDDEWHEDKIETMVSLMETNQCVALCSDFRLIDESSNPLSKQSFKIHPFIRDASDGELAQIRFRQLVFGNIVQGCTYCFLKQVKDLYLKLDNDEVDHDHQIMFVSTLSGKVYFLKKELIDYRIHSSNAIGLAEKDAGMMLELKKPSRKPFMVRFIDELDSVMKVKNKTIYKCMYYLRIPYFVSKFRK